MYLTENNFSYAFYVTSQFDFVPEAPFAADVTNFVKIDVHISNVLFEVKFSCKKFTTCLARDFGLASRKRLVN